MTRRVYDRKPGEFQLSKYLEATLEASLSVECFAVNLLNNFDLKENQQTLAQREIENIRKRELMTCTFNWSYWIWRWRVNLRRSGRRAIGDVCRVTIRRIKARRWCRIQSWWRNKLWNLRKTNSLCRQVEREKEALAAHLLPNSCSHIVSRLPATSCWTILAIRRCLVGCCMVDSNDPK